MLISESVDFSQLMILAKFIFKLQILDNIPGMVNAIIYCLTKSHSHVLICVINIHSLIYAYVQLLPMV